MKIKKELIRRRQFLGKEFETRYVKKLVFNKFCKIFKFNEFFKYNFYIYPFLIKNLIFKTKLKNFSINTDRSKGVLRSIRTDRYDFKIMARTLCSHYFKQSS